MGNTTNDRLLGPVRCQNPIIIMKLITIYVEGLLTRRSVQFPLTVALHYYYTQRDQI
jgi:hypothetical protein